MPEQDQVSAAARVTAGELLSAAATILEQEGSQALTVRRIARAAGTSTMAIYSRFGATGALHGELRARGFARLATATSAAARATADPVAALAAAAFAYLDFGVAEPRLYRFMFVDPPPVGPGPGDGPGRAAFEAITDLVAACVDSARFQPEDPARVTMWAAELWAMQHGVTTLALTATVPPELARHVLADALLRLCVGFGDDPARVRGSLAAAGAAGGHR
ncbi:TetR/AcrR family transcriptional regulator [Nocardia sp. NPDC050435]|uniref:TetR/AcrR family transcriptional regulator n=1 Tax=Nocardia sp. NPDC050435 TaxID=3155040 RepID=UPI0033E48C19